MRPKEYVLNYSYWYYLENGPVSRTSIIYHCLNRKQFTEEEIILGIEDNITSGTLVYQPGTEKSKWPSYLPSDQLVQYETMMKECQRNSIAELRQKIIQMKRESLQKRIESLKQLIKNYTQCQPKK
jgi:hypothetical protein